MNDSPCDMLPERSAPPLAFSLHPQPLALADSLVICTSGIRGRRPSAPCFCKEQQGGSYNPITVVVTKAHRAMPGASPFPQTVTQPPGACPPGSLCGGDSTEHHYAISPICADSVHVPVLQNNQGPPLVGLITIACHLVKEAKRSDLLGESAASRAVVQQWLEYRVTRLDGCTKEDSKSILKELNIHLQDNVYLAGNHFTLADTLMYYGIHPLIVDLTVQEKEQYLNVARWFDHIQHVPRLRHHLPPVAVLRNRIYTGRHH
ncbi:Eukaryotic translation elongation factor 1 epsilon-1 [Oryzias melastigma]|uniref:Eukaryotic translation elongation factor 1 epsilon-1 n=1 Tax=Oryzias melastigma TaxID=30732 RepID=A0A834BZG8_ORYME|nr:Eukaryotic translation elongation factor 1 epsilon-1 [Oryzias melastigma]